MEYIHYICIFIFLVLLYLIYWLNKKLVVGKELIDYGEIKLKDGINRYNRHRWTWYGAIINKFTDKFDDSMAKIANGRKMLAKGKLKYKLELVALFILLICAVILVAFFVNSIWNLIFDKNIF